MALRAGLVDLEETVGDAHGTMALTGRTGLPRRAGLAARAVAGLALVPGGHADLHRAAPGGVLKRDFKLEAHVVAADALLAGGTAAAHAATAEDVAEDVAEGALEVGAVHVAKATEAAGTARSAGIHARLAVAVVGGALLVVGKHGVGFTDFLELLFGDLVTRIAVRMVLHGHATIGLLDVVGGSVLADAEHLVIIAIRHYPIPAGSYPVFFLIFSKLEKGRHRVSEPTLRLMR